MFVTSSGKRLLLEQANHQIKQGSLKKKMEIDTGKNQLKLPSQTSKQNIKMGEEIRLYSQEERIQL